jgi:hypothetical protein
LAQSPVQQHIALVCFLVWCPHNTASKHFAAGRLSHCNIVRGLGLHVIPSTHVKQQHCQAIMVCHSVRCLLPSFTTFFFLE